MENNLVGQLGEVRMTISVTRKATGKVDTYDLVGNAVMEDSENVKEKDNGSNPHDSGA